MLTQERLKELLHYNPDTGIFINLTQRRGRAKKGVVAGWKNTYGYINIRVDYKVYKAHRLAWLYVHGNFPEKSLDHINEIKYDNYMINLRLATVQENNHNISTSNKNNASGLRGVCWHKFSGKWRAQIKINGNIKHLGLFNTSDEASEAYLAAKKELHPFWKEKVA